MGFFYSDQGRFCTSTNDFPPVTFLTPKGISDTYAATVIQKW